jgi:hypothetical protein
LSGLNFLQTREYTPQRAAEQLRADSHKRAISIYPYGLGHLWPGHRQTASAAGTGSTRKSANIFCLAAAQ